MERCGSCGKTAVTKDMYSTKLLMEHGGEEFLFKKIDSFKEAMRKELAEARHGAQVARKMGYGSTEDPSYLKRVVDAFEDLVDYVKNAHAAMVRGIENDEAGRY